MPFSHGGWSKGLLVFYGDEHPRGVVSTSWSNAWTLRQACLECGVDLRRADEKGWYPLPKASPTTADSDWLFFTEEESLTHALKSELPNPYWPRTFPLELLDDKLAFYQWCTKQDQPTVPTSDLEELPTSFPCLVKARRSWWQGQAVPKGWVCYSQGQFEQVLRDLPLPREFFVVQPWLNGSDGAEYSVGGFFDHTDPSNRLLTVVKKLDVNPRPGTIGACLTVADPEDLINRTISMLESLNYIGPFEMQFIVSSGRHLVLELNPRFWLQHGVFMVHGNGLVRRYLGLLPAKDEHIPENFLWTDSLWFLRQLARGRFNTLWGILKQAKSGILFCPRLRELPYLLPHILWRKWKQRNP